MPTLGDVDAMAAAVLGGAVGLFVGAVAAIAFRVSERAQAEPGTGGQPLLPVGAVAVLQALRSATVVVDRADRLVRVSPSAYALGALRDGRLALAAVREAVEHVREDGEVRALQIELARGRSRPLILSVRVARLSDELTLVLIDDTTQARRVDDVRRDFLANVSHELKTPVAALSLLAESVLAAPDDAEAVERFAGRMQVEADRLSRLVRELIDLSRVQGDAPLSHAEVIDVEDLVRDATDRTRLPAGAAGIDLVSSVEPALHVYGDREQLVSALKNLIDNALAYSPSRTRVAVAAKKVADRVEISVSDQGIGIPARDIDRIFERFYRVDPARSRATGGTGLGLSIVKHVCANHGGEVDVWSVEGAGSTFTLRLPAQLGASLGGPRTPPTPLPQLRKVAQ
jgi:two-component system sensor histidine kinase SenX3